MTATQIHEDAEPAEGSRSNPNNLRILVVDDVGLMRRALRKLVEDRTAWEVCGEAANGREAIEKAQELVPDIILIDLSMPVMNGLDATRQIRKLLPAVNVLVVTEHNSKEVMRAAADAGARGYLTKSKAGLLPEAIKAVREQKTYFNTE